MTQDNIDLARLLAAEMRMGSAVEVLSCITLHLCVLKPCALTQYSCMHGIDMF